MMHGETFYDRHFTGRIHTKVDSAFKLENYQTSVKIISFYMHLSALCLSKFWFCD